MATLFQIYAPMNSLKAMVREMAQLWHPGDSLLLMADSAAYFSWLSVYIDDLNQDEEFESRIDGIDAIYVLADDIEALNDSAKLNSDFSKVNVISDQQWVKLTQEVDRVITLNSAL